MHDGVWAALAIGLVGFAAGMVVLAVERHLFLKRLHQNREMFASQAKELRAESARQTAVQERIASALETLVADRKRPQP